MAGQQIFKEAAAKLGILPVESMMDGDAGNVPILEVLTQRHRKRQVERQREDVLSDHDIGRDFFQQRQQTLLNPAQ